MAAASADTVERVHVADIGDPGRARSKVEFNNFPEIAALGVDAEGGGGLVTDSRNSTSRPATSVSTLAKF